MSGLYKNHQTDNNKEVNGVPIEFEANDDGTIPTFIVSRTGDSNKEYTKALRVATKPYQRLIDLKQLSPEKDREIYQAVFISSVLKGWSNVRDENDQPMEFTAANAKKLFTDIPDIYDQLTKASSDAALFRKYSLEDQAKN